MRLQLERCSPGSTTIVVVVLDFPALSAALLGGLLGVGASLGGVELARRRQAGQWERELLVAIVGEALKSMQRYMREILSLAYGDGPPYRREVIDGVEHVFPRASSRPREQDATFDEVVSDWNSALHKLLVSAPPTVVRLSRAIDHELDRLLDLAIDGDWSREGFRSERVEVGRLVAELVVETRSAAGAPPVAVTNAWTWADRS